MRNFSGRFVEEIKKYNSHTVPFFPQKMCCLYHVEKYCTAGQATDDYMVHAHCMLDT